MGTRLPRNFAVDPVNGAYGDEEDRLAQAIGDAVNGPGGPGSGTSAATITSGIDSSANVTAIRTAAEQNATDTSAIALNTQPIADAIGTTGDPSTANTVIGIIQNIKNSFLSLLTSVGLTLGSDLTTLKDSGTNIEADTEAIALGVGDDTDAAATDPTSTAGLTGIVKGLWRDTILKFDELIANLGAKAALTPVSHDETITPNNSATLVASGTEFRFLRTELIVDSICAVEVFIGATSVAKFVGADVITLPYEDFGTIDNNSGADALTVTVTEAASNVRITGSTWYEVV